MPPEHDDHRERQLAALRRYVTDLDVRRQQQGGEARPAAERRRLPSPWLPLTLLLMAASLAGGIAIGGQRDPAGNGSGSVAATSTSAATSPTAAPECAEAVERANESISHAVKVAGALREHTEIMNRLFTGKLSAEAARRTGTASLITGSAESAKFDLALADYKQVVDRCKLRVP
jgi:hypothetical protein